MTNTSIRNYDCRSKIGRCFRNQTRPAGPHEFNTQWYFSHTRLGLFSNPSLTLVWPLSLDYLLWFNWFMVTGCTSTSTNHWPKQFNQLFGFRNIACAAYTSIFYGVMNSKTAPSLQTVQSSTRKQDNYGKIKANKVSLWLIYVPKQGTIQSWEILFWRPQSYPKHLDEAELVSKFPQSTGGPKKFRWLWNLGRWQFIKERGAGAQVTRWAYRLGPFLDWQFLKFLFYFYFILISWAKQNSCITEPKLGTTWQFLKFSLLWLFYLNIHLL